MRDRKRKWHGGAMHKHHGASVTKMKITTVSESPNARYVLAMQDVSKPTSHLIKLVLGRARLQRMRMRETHECVHRRGSVHHRGRAALQGRVSFMKSAWALVCA